MPVTSTQIGSLAENIVCNELMVRSMGRLSPFRPVADDDGIDLLVFDKFRRRSVPLQIKARTATVKSRGKRGNTVHFGVRKATWRSNPSGYLLAVLLDPDLRAIERSWLLPLGKLAEVGRQTKSTLVIRPSRSLSTRDKFKRFQCADFAEVVRRLVALTDAKSGDRSH